MGFFDPVTTDISSLTQYQSQVPAWLDKYFQDVGGAAMGLAQEPYQPYGGPRIAPFAADQSRAFDLTRSGVGLGENIFNNYAMPYLQRGVTAPTASGIEQYINPYNTLVTDRVVRELGRQNDASRLRDKDRAIAAGAFGGSRHGIIDAERERNFNQLVGDVRTTGASNAFNQGLGQFNQQQGMLMQGSAQAAGLAGGLQAVRGQDVANLLSTGAMQQQFGQSNLDTRYGDYQRQQYYPYEQLGFTSGILRGIPTPGLVPTQTTSQTPGPSIGQQVGGLGLGLVGLGGLGMFNGLFS